MANRWAGVAGSALKGGAEVAIPYALERTADERRARLQQMRDAALHGQRQALQQGQQAFQAQQAKLDRSQRERLGQADVRQGNRRLDLQARGLDQRRAEFQEELDFQREVHGDRMGLQERELEMLGSSGGRPTDLQYMINFLQTELDMSPEQALDRYQELKRSPRDFVQTYVLSMIESRSEFADPIDEQALAEKGWRLYEEISGGGDRGRPSRRDTSPAGGGIEFLGFED